MRNLFAIKDYKSTPTIWLTIIGLSVLISGCTGLRAVDEEIFVTPEVVEAKGTYRKQYVLVPGDRIDVSVWQVPEVSRIVVIRSDGYISLPTVSGVKAAGLTFDELEQELTRRFSQRLRDPNVTVIAVKIRDSMVYVLGDVTVQRAIPLHQADTAMEAIAIAGGFKRTSASRDVSIIRVGDDGVLRAIPIDALSNKQPSPYLSLSIQRLQPDDIVFIPETNRSEAIRFLDDFIGRPLSYINLIGSTVLNYKVIQDADF